MNLKTLKDYGLLLLVLSIFTINHSCSNSNDTASRVQIKMVDAPGDYEEVNVEIIDVQYNLTGNEAGWQSFTPSEGYPINVDLTQLVAGNSLILVDQIIPSGMMHQIRLVLGENNTLKLEGDENLISMDTPSAMQSGLKLNLNTTLEGGFTYTFILDWVVSESVVEAGNTGMYNLRPVIKVNAEVSSGTISGLVVDETENPMGDIMVKLFDTNNELVTDTMTDMEGNFIFQGIAGGSYVLQITTDGYNQFTAETAVAVGEITDVGMLSLTPAP